MYTTKNTYIYKFNATLSLLIDY